MIVLWVGLLLGELELFGPNVALVAALTYDAHDAAMEHYLAEEEAKPCCNTP